MASIIFRIILVATFVAPTVTLADAPVQATFYVAPNGTGPAATLDAPGSLNGARDLVRHLTSNMHGDIIVYLRGGLYALTTPFQLRESDSVQDSGSNGFNVIYEAYPGETPVLSGGIPVTGWTLFDKDKNIFRAMVPEGTASRQLYVNDRRADRARGPQLPAGWSKTATGFTITDTTMQTWGDPSDMEIVSRSSWKHLRCGIASITGTTVLMKTPGWNNSSSSPNLGTPLNGQGTQQINKVDWVENALELLQTPGQWYLDRKAAYVYYIPLPGEDLATAKVVLPVLETLLDVSGSDVDHPIHHVEFKGITFQDATWMGPSGDQGYADNQTGVIWVDLPPKTAKTPGNLSFQYAHDVTFERNVITQMGGVGLDFGHGPQHDTILGNCISDISCNGIFLGEFTDAKETDPKAWTDGNIIKDNYITHVGAEYEDGIGICVGYSRNLVLDHNDISFSPYMGLTVGWGWSKLGYSFKNSITNNHVHDFMLVLEDGGGIYTLGNQGDADNLTEWTGNYVHNGKNAQGLYSDEGSGFMEIKNNVVCQVGANWMNIWTKSIHDIRVHDNFSDKTKPNNNGTNCSVDDATPVDPKALSAPAQAIADNAGLEPAFADVKDKVRMPVEEMVNDTDSGITYSGSWSGSDHRKLGDYGDDIHVTTQNGAAASFTFTGDGIDYLTEVNADEGDVAVSVDGTVVQTVSCANPERVAGKVLFHTSWTTEGKHEIKIEKQSGQYMLLDAFRVHHHPKP